METFPKEITTQFNIGIRAIVCPKQKLVKILVGKNHKKAKLVKVYRFKETIPQYQKTISVTKYDFGEWAVSEQQYQEEKIITVYDEKVIESIRERALQYYIDTTPSTGVTLTDRLPVIGERVIDNN